MPRQALGSTLVAAREEGCELEGPRGEEYLQEVHVGLGELEVGVAGKEGRYGEKRDRVAPTFDLETETIKWQETDPPTPRPQPSDTHNAADPFDDFHGRGADAVDSQLGQVGVTG